MAGIKRRFDTADGRDGKRTKVKDGGRVNKNKPVVESKSKSKKPQRKVESSEDDEEEEDFNFSEEGVDVDDSPSDSEDTTQHQKSKTRSESLSSSEKQANGTGGGALSVKSGTSSKESHAKQKALAQERKAAKPNSDLIARSKKLWERLRRKSHVPLEERKKLVAELYSIVTGRVKEFVFKHDSVRVIQTALKYASPQQRKDIAKELKGNYCSLAESKYAKFLIGKLLVHGDSEVRDIIIPEFYGHVKRLMRHPEASWIVDDIYRTVATATQRAMLLCEWYGAEFVVFRPADGVPETADLAEIISKNPEKRGPIMKYLHEFINHLVQKKFTGFTMLHDAMLQYFLNTTPGSEEAAELVQLILGDEEGDLAKNLAFTKSGARLVSLCFAYSNAKDRKLLLRLYRGTMKMLAGDVNGQVVLLTAYEVIDDTKLSSKSIFPELLNQASTAEARHEELLLQITDLTARIPILYSFAEDTTRWLVIDPDHKKILDEVLAVRSQTSKKDPNTRRQELVKAASPTLLEFIAASADSLVEYSFGCQFITEVLFSADGDKTAALTAIAALPTSKSEALKNPSAGRMLKALVQGGRFNSKTKCVEKVQPPLNFHGLLYEQIAANVMAWVTGANPFVILALVEAEDFGKRGELVKTLTKHKKVLAELSAKEPANKGEKRGAVSSAAKLLLERVG
ncbi:puf family RNA-binding protein [Histoplasma capsulatum H143]|uniref:Puf family RNA-binding protein n=1 Tax=Ajellomyces capsulatus (strain H143) TaxID=544712 RepID=C6H9C1_AJECH|nr:puf family RNA-binding protein [Histoplasma capsulatum H143]